jgi:hypothetical protein
MTRTAQFTGKWRDFAHSWTAKSTGFRMNRLNPGGAENSPNPGMQKLKIHFQEYPELPNVKLDGQAEKRRKRHESNLT